MNILKLEDAMDEVLYHRFYYAILENNIQGCKQILEMPEFYTKLPLAKQMTQTDGTLQTPFLHLSCIYRRSDILKMLLDKGVDITCTDIHGRTPLQTVITYWPKTGPWEKPYDTIFDEAELKFWKNIQDKHDSAQKCLLTLLAYGANSNDRYSCTGRSVLHVCAQKELLSALDVLLMFGADIEVLDNDMCTPLLVSAKTGMTRSVKHLLMRSANYNVTDIDGNTVLHFLSTSKRISVKEMTSLFLIFPQLLFSINMTTLSGSTPLHMACSSGNGEKIQYLLNKNARSDVKDAQGRSPLYLLLDNNHLGHCILGVLALLESSAQISVLDRYGEVPRYLVQTRKSLFKERLLQASRIPTSLTNLCEHRVLRLLKNVYRSALHVAHLALPSIVKENIINYKRDRRTKWESILSVM